MKKNTNTGKDSSAPQSLSALLTLLQDENIKVASLAMEQFLTLGQLAEEALAEHQESHDPQLRQRIHQISSIMARRRARGAFIDDMAAEKMSTWDGVVHLNMLYDPRCNPGWVAGEVAELAARLKDGPVTSPRVSALMREQEFRVPEEDVLDIDLYLVQRVLETRYGSPAVLGALARQVGALAGWPSTLVLHSGRFCLIDRMNLLLDPSEGWHISKLKAADRIHPCSRRDVILGVLSQLFLVALVEGNLRDLHHFGDLLTALNANADSLPYPMGPG